MLSNWPSSSILSLQGGLSDDRHAPSRACTGAEVGCSITRSEGTTSDVTLLLNGEFGMSNRDLLRSALEEALTFRLVTVDLSQTTDIDASVLGVLARFARLRKEGHVAPLQISHANAHCLELLSICKLRSVFYIEEDSW